LKQEFCAFNKFVYKIHEIITAMKKDVQEDADVEDKVFGGKPAFGEIFNFKVIAILIIALVLIVIGLIFIPGLL
jgi:hypothetical protein